jgi:hypothetical protein
MQLEIINFIIKVMCLQHLLKVACRTQSEYHYAPDHVLACFQLLIAEAVRLLWLIYSHYMNFRTIQILSTVATVVAWFIHIKIPRWASSIQKNNLQIDEKVLQATVSILYSNWTYRNIINEEELEEIGARLETFPWKSLVWLEEQIDVCQSQNATELLHLHPHKTTAVSKLYDAYCEVKVDF